MLTLVFGMPVSKGKVNRSLDLCLIAKETTGDCEQGFVFKHVYTLHLQVKYFTSYVYKLRYYGILTIYQGVHITYFKISK